MNHGNYRSFRNHIDGTNYELCNWLASGTAEPGLLPMAVRPGSSKVMRWSAARAVPSEATSVVASAVDRKKWLERRMTNSSLLSFP